MQMLLQGASARQTRPCRCEHHKSCRHIATITQDVHNLASITVVYVQINLQFGKALIHYSYGKLR